MSMSVTTGINEVYDPKTNTWETKSPMPIDRAGMQANMVGGRIYISGGFGQYSSYQNSTEAYDPITDSWSLMAPMPNTQVEFASAALDGKIFFISDKLQIFIPQSNQWTTGSSPPKPIFQGAAAAPTESQYPQQIYFVQGGPNSNQIYSTVTDSWTVGASMPDPDADRLGLALVVVNDTVYALGGINTNRGIIKVIADNEAYLPIGYDSLPTASPTPQISPTVPEFPSWILMSMLTIMMGSGLLVYFKKHKQIINRKLG
jgi:N-acetylneuraminic acid mutarotase